MPIKEVTAKFAIHLFIHSSLGELQETSPVAQQWRIHLQCRRQEFEPWVWKIPWSRKWQPTPVFLPGESHGQRSLAGYSPWGHKESDTTEAPEHACVHVNYKACLSRR